MGSRSACSGGGGGGLWRRHHRNRTMNKTIILWTTVGVLAGYMLSDRLAKLPVVSSLPKL